MARRGRSTGRAATAAATLVAAALAIGAPASAKCVIKQNCTGGVGCRPVPVEPWETEPFPQPAPNPTCPQYAASGCCTSEQNLLLMVNFLSIQSAFANIDNGGCPACAYNVEAFWCEYSCSPDQDTFLSIIGVADVPDPTRGGELTEVLQTRIVAHRNYTCAAYGSCDKVAKVTETSAMSNAEGFFAYQGQYEAIQHGAFIDFQFVDDTDPRAPAAMNPPPYSCCSWPLDKTKPAGGNASCPCAYCGGMCAGGTCAGAGAAPDGITDLGVVVTPWYNGIVPATIGGVWGGVVAVVATTTWWRWWRRGRRADGGDGGWRGRGGSAGSASSGGSTGFSAM
jgi:hypothetical protein